MGWDGHGNILTPPFLTFLAFLPFLPCPQVLIYEAAAFQGRSFTISRDIYDLKRLPEPGLPTVGSLRVLGGW